MWTIRVGSAQLLHYVPQQLCSRLLHERVGYTRAQELRSNHRGTVATIEDHGVPDT